MWSCVFGAEIERWGQGELIYSGEIDFTECDIDDCNILIFDKIVYEGSFAGKAMTLTDYMEQYSNAEFEILHEGYSEYSTIYSGWIRQEDEEPVSGILNIYNTGEIIYRLDTQIPVFSTIIYEFAGEWIINKADKKKLMDEYKMMQKRIWI